MKRRILCVLAMLGSALLAGCGTPTPADIAAQACDAHVRTQTSGKPYQLDLDQLAASATSNEDSKLLTAPVVVNAGLTDQSTQQLECTVRMNADGSADILNLRFIW